MPFRPYLAALALALAAAPGCDPDRGSRVGFDSANEAHAVRARLLRYLWPQGRLPDREPEVVERSADVPALGGLDSLARLDRLTVKLPATLRSVAFLLFPKTGGEELIIYHHGHRGSCLQARETLQLFLARGYTVLALSMPLIGEENRRPAALAADPSWSHDPLVALARPGLRPLSLFVEPVAVSLNYALGRRRYRDVSMIGISGGGWTAQLYAAIDPRVRRSYPVAGSLPRRLRSERETGDYEQHQAGLYEIASYLDLYALGAFGEGRRQLQVLNTYDSCCFASGGREDAIRAYEEQVQAALERLGAGSFEVFFDSSHREHQISPRALQRILKDL